MSRIFLVAVIILALCAVAMLAGCPKKQHTELQGAPSAYQPPPATHQMPGGEQMPGAKHEEPTTGEAKPTSTKAEMASCPVLGTTMTKDKMIPYDYKGKTYYLCCPDCVTQFKANPEKFIKNPAKPLPAGAPMPSG
jgi:YHS domain-containing protein